jgi:hypothetical protein
VGDKDENQSEMEVEGLLPTSQERRSDDEDANGIGKMQATEDLVIPQPIFWAKVSVPQVEEKRVKGAAQ